MVTKLQRKTKPADDGPDPTSTEDTARSIANRDRIAKHFGHTTNGLPTTAAPANCPTCGDALHYSTQSKAAPSFCVTCDREVARG